MPQSLEVDIGECRPNRFNTNHVSPGNERKLDESLRRLGMFKPLVVRDAPNDGGPPHEIVGGEHRWRSALRLGIRRVPVISLGEVSEARAREVMLADNARFGADDAGELAGLLGEMADMAPDWRAQDLLPYTDDDLAGIFAASDATHGLDGGRADPGGEFSEAEDDFAAAVPAGPQPVVLRFKLSPTDAERVSALLARVRKRFGFDASDALTNDGDALVHVLLSRKPPETAPGAPK